MEHYLLAIDQGTTNSRAIIFNRQGKIKTQHDMVLKQNYPQDGWIEQDPMEMFNNTVECCRLALKKANLSAKAITAVGISNQRETTIIWDKTTGNPIYPAIGWQDRRTYDLCKLLSQTYVQKLIHNKTGLVLDPYFSATKIIWLLENVPGARKKAEKNELLFGTVDTFLLWKLTKGQSHATDATNASRTLLFNIHTQQWDEELLKEFTIPHTMLPKVLDNAAYFGDIDAEFFGDKIAILGMAGDQQAAVIGQACFQPGMVKVTYGTGCFMLLNTGNNVIHSNNQLLSTVAYRIQGQVTYGLEGSIFSAGSIVKWLRDQLQLIKDVNETELLANYAPDTNGLYFIPAFTGLGAPYWNPEARAAIIGIGQNSKKEHIVRAALESIGYQTRDLLDAMAADAALNINTLRVDGGMTVNAWLLQFLSDILNLEVQRPHCIETTALGAAYLAGLQAGLYASLEEIGELWQCAANFTPHMQAQQRDNLYEGWKLAVERVLLDV